MNYINSIKNKLSRQEKTAFIAALVAGFLSHGYGMTNSYIYHDATILDGLGATFSIGRWFLGFLGMFNEKILGNYSLSFLNVILSILLIAFSSMIVVKTLKVKTTFVSMFIGTIMSVYPVVTSTFAYHFTSVYYFIALLLSVYAIYYISENSGVKDYIIAVILLALGAGIYQAYFPVATTLAISLVMKEMLEGKDEIKVIVNKGIRLVVTLALGMVSYLVLNKISMVVTKSQVTSYQGADAVGSLSIAKIPSRLIQSYMHFFYIKWNGINSAKCMWVFIGLFLVCAIVVIVGKLIKNDISVMHRVLFVILSALFPLAVNLVYLMSTSESFSVHTLMRYPTLFVLITPVVLIEDDAKVLGKISAVLLTIISFAYIYSNNICYLKMDLVQEELTSYFAVLESRITSAEGYYDQMPIVFYGENNINDSAMTDLSELYPDTQILGYEYSAKDLVNVESWQRYMKYHAGYTPVVMNISPEIANSDEFKNMNLYPNNGSIKMIDGAMVVKFCEY